MKEQIHSTIGVYPNINSFWKANGVRAENLQAHIDYNVKYRPGRALFVDGKCVHKGSLTEEQIKEVEQKMIKAPHIPKRDTAPYQ